MTTTTSTPAAPLPLSSVRRRRALSLTGVVPLGLYFLACLWLFAHALYGRTAFDTAVDRLARTPALGAIELLLAGIPLAVHTALGIASLGASPDGASSFGVARRWSFVLGRITGVLALAFFALYALQYRVPCALGRLARGDLYAHLAEDLQRPIVFAAYVVGITATVFHFANGLWTAGGTWGLVTSARAVRVSAWVCAVLGVVLWLVGIDTLFHFALRCGGVLPLPAFDRLAVCGIE